jgi:hypothetical protein
MPPPSKKAENKAKAKVIEDKTFGLKNKNKSAKVSKYIQQVELSVKQKGQKQQKEVDQAALIKQRKKEEEEKNAELAILFKPAVSQPKVPFGTDPKTVLCAFWKASGVCAKGDKCKFSHDSSVERKSAKINLYADTRDTKSPEDSALEEDTMDKWDQTKLENVVNRKHSAQATTDIVCRYFLEAIEQRKYGWFWECPNGGDKCKYRHALPPGFVLKSSSALSSKEEADALSLEEFLETERHRIDKTTPVTAESFAVWKAKRKEQATTEEAARAKAKEAEFKAGKLHNVSGRDLFVYQPDLFRDDDEAMEVDYNAREDISDGEALYEVEDPDIFLDASLDDLQIADDCSGDSKSGEDSENKD